MDDAALDHQVALARAGDREAFLAVAVAVQSDIRLVLAACASHPQQVEELLHETLVSAWRHLDQYRGDGSFVAWVKAIARNHLRKELRARRQFTSLDRLDALIIDRQLDRMEEDERLGERERQVERLRRCLGDLPEHVRTLVSAHHLDGTPVAEIAQAVKRTANWVAVSLFRARKALARCMQQQEGAGHAS
jgi:RNA polymerase sigma-70 factor (ECF subfamily)